MRGFTFSSEILENIISFIPVEDKKTLASCTIVSREMCKIASPYLFANLSIDVTDIPDFLQAESNPAQYVQDLRITSRLEGQPKITAPFLRMIVPAFPNLRSLSLPGLVISGSTTDQLYTIPVQLSSLHIDCGKFSTKQGLVDILHLFGRVGTVYIRNVVPLPDVMPNRGFVAPKPLCLFPPYPQCSLEGINFRLAATYLDIDPPHTLDSHPDGIIVLLRMLQHSDTMFTLTSLSIRIDHFVVAAELGRMLLLCKNTLQGCELNFQLPYYSKLTMVPLRGYFSTS